jgi:hypothetical protein
MDGTQGCIDHVICWAVSESPHGMEQAPGWDTHFWKDRCSSIQSSMARDLAWHMVHTRIKRLIGNAIILSRANLGIGS